MESASTVSSTVEALFIGSFFDISLLTITVAQAWSYFRRNKDGWVLQTFVGSVVLISMAESIAVILALRNFLITHSGDYNYLQIHNMFLHTGFFLTYIVFSLTHLFFAKRVFAVCRRKWLFIISVAMTVTMFGFGLASSVTPVFFGFPKGLGQRRNAGLVAHFIAGALDIVVTAVLTVSLSEFRVAAKTFFARSTKELLHRVLVYTMSRGIIMTFAQSVHVAMFISRPKDTVFWASTHFIISKLYALTTLVTLNLRRSSPEDAVIVDEVLSMRFANRDSIEMDEEPAKARAIQSAPGSLQWDGPNAEACARI